MYREILDGLSYVMNIISVIVISYGVLRSTIRLLAVELRHNSLATRMMERQSIRAYLGSYILLGLEFLIAADIIATIAHPSVQEIILLTAIVIIRTFISYFLAKEIEQVMKLEKEGI